MWDSFNTYGHSFQNSFETLCNQLFERYLVRSYSNDMIEFKVINGAGGDGGIEAYGKLIDNTYIAVQSKWFKQAINSNELNQIKNSITTALKIRPNIKEYIICIPHNISSVKIGRGNKPTQKSEDERIKSLENEIKKSHPNTKITWWFEHDILNELQIHENEGINKYWFEKEVIHSNLLKDKFNLQKTNYWLKERYVGDLHTKGDIQNLIDRQLYNLTFRKKIISKIIDLKNKVNYSTNISEKFINVTLNSDDLLNKLKMINNTLDDLMVKLNEFEEQLINGSQINVIINESEDIQIISLLDDAIDILEAINPSDLQKPIYHNLKINLRELNSNVILPYFDIENKLTKISTSLVLGKPGTGKTLGLAYAVEECLNNSTPAILIQAKSAKSNDWTQILSQELELNNWNKNEILSALETMAIRKDCQNAINKINNVENTNILICIDGLDEDISNEARWFDRINESIELASKYKRIKFVFSAREYFYNNQKLPINNTNFYSLRLKREGDVKVEDVAIEYFKKYDIIIKNHTLIKGIDSLFALKLFCENYKNKTIKDNETVETAISELITLKVEKLNSEFLDSLEERKAKSKKPVSDFLNIISDLFYLNPEVSHNQIIDLEIETKIKYLNFNEIELLIDFLSNNGIIIKYERYTESDSILKSKESFYTFSYQSILETIISSKISHLIINEKISELPDSIFNQIPFSNELDDDSHKSYRYFIANQKIIQNIINDVFIKKNKLIGFDDFLTNGFTDDEIFEFQINAIYAAPNKISSKYKDWVTKTFNDDYFKRLKILQDLIIPLAFDNESVFNALFLHEILKNKSSVFERDKFWSGLDSTEKNIITKEKNAFEYELNNWSVANILDNNFDLDETDMFDGLPLIYTWGLTNIDQKLRENLRVKLTKWGLIAPLEFKKLLDLMIPIDDPQIHEDLASITLGIATKCKDKNSILEIALWSLANIFNNTDKHRNIIVRYGFRAIVERAFQYNLIPKSEVIKSRPIKRSDIILLDIDKKYIKKPSEQFYPIGHDLAWYVIKEAYDDFLSISTGFNSHSFEKSNPYINNFFKKYSSSLKGSKSPRTWGMSAALAYIKSLGFNRVNGSSFTDASHGSKSKKFTYEEKYVWLAVHYLKGYLSDYLPYTYDDETQNYIWIDDYSRIVHINNPIDDIQNNLESEVDDYLSPPLWVIKEELSPEINISKNIQNEINRIVTKDPKINFSNWLKFNNSDFNLEDKKEYLAIYQNTGLTNSSKTINSFIECYAYLIAEDDFKLFLNEIKKDSRYISPSHFACPNTDTYTNPSNLFWMDWISENNNMEEFDEDKFVFNCLTRVVTKKVDGEEEVIIPSKRIRKLIKISELEYNSYYDLRSNEIGFKHQINTKRFSYGDNQEIILLNKDELLNALKKKKLKIFWLASHFIKKNPLNKDIENLKYIENLRQYIVWQDDQNQLKSHEYFNKKFKNG